MPDRAEGLRRLLRPVGKAGGFFAMTRRAPAARLRPGDLIESYAGQPLFSASDLRDATAAGERGELERVQVRRAGRSLDVNLSRGPLGVQLDTTRAEPLQPP